MTGGFIFEKFHGYESFAHYFRVMKNITLSADEAMIEQARETARTQKTTLNQLFRNWLSELAGRRERDQQLALLMDRLDYVKSGGPFNREDMNER